MAGQMNRRELLEAVAWQRAEFEATCELAGVPPVEFTQAECFAGVRRKLEALTGVRELAVRGANRHVRGRFHADAVAKVAQLRRVYTVAELADADYAAHLIEFRKEQA